MEPTLADRSSPLTIDDQEVVLLHLKETPRINIQDVVFLGFTFHLERRRRGTTWLAFHRTNMPRDTTWIGFSLGTPPTVVDGIQGAFEATGMQVERSMGRALQLGMHPFARLSDDGLEILVSSGDPIARRVVERSGAKPVARGFTAPQRRPTVRNVILGPT